LSAAATATDFRPNRLTAVVEVLKNFIREFFDQNPLSHLGIVLMRSGVAECLTELSSRPEMHIKELTGALSTGGPASLQNALLTATESLKPIPSYGFREVLIVFAGLTTCDPGEISDAITAAKANRCRVSVVGLAAEVYICREIADQTGGSYGVALNETHLQELILGHASPPPAAASVSTARLVWMGFPRRNAEDVSGSAFVGQDAELRSGGFSCPKCSSRVEELPCQCHVCGLTLVSSPHLARSYHHLFPVEEFLELSPAERGGAGGTCYGCLAPLLRDEDDVCGRTGIVVRCPHCRNVFCFDCDTYVHESLHNCPGCEALADASKLTPGEGR